MTSLTRHQPPLLAPASPPSHHPLFTHRGSTCHELFPAAHLPLTPPSHSLPPCPRWSTLTALQLLGLSNNAGLQGSLPSAWAALAQSGHTPLTNISGDPLICGDLPAGWQAGFVSSALSGLGSPCGLTSPPAPTGAPLSLQAACRQSENQCTAVRWTSHLTHSTRHTSSRPQASLCPGPSRGPATQGRPRTWWTAGEGGGSEGGGWALWQQEAESLGGSMTAGMGQAEVRWS